MFYYVALCIRMMLTPIFWKALLVSVTGFVTVIASYVAYQHWKYDCIPGPRRHSFWLGHFSSLYGCLAENNVVSKYLYENIKKFGYTIRLFMFHGPFVVSVDQETVKEILTPEKHQLCTITTKTEGFIFGARWQGTGLLLDSNTERRKLRKSIYEPLFQKDYHEACIPDMNSTIDRILKEFYFLADGKTLLSMSEQFERAVLDIICKVHFGKDVYSVEEQRDPFKKAVFTLLSGRRKEKTDPWTNISIFQKNLRKSVRDACGLLRKTGAEWIEERKQKLSKGEVIQNDVLTTLIEFSKQPGISKDDVLDDFVVFLMVFLEHVPNTLSFLLRDSTKNPEIYNRLVEEVDGTMKGKGNVDATSLDNVPYMDMVLKETLRMYPTDVEVVRILSCPIMSKGRSIPKGTAVIVSPLLSGRNEDFFEDAMVFNPGRFSKDKPAPSPEVYFPYTDDTKEKLGRFNEIIIKVLLIKMLKKLKIHYFSDQAFTETNLPTLRPTRGGVAVFNKRDNAAPFIYDISER